MLNIFLCDRENYYLLLTASLHPHLQIIKEGILSSLDRLFIQLHDKRGNYEYDPATEKTVI